MFVSFLMPHVDRGAGPLFHLIMLLQMSRFAPDEICFLGDDAYFDEAQVPFDEELMLGSIRFTCASRERFRAYRKAALPFAAVAPLYEEGRSHLDAFQALLTTAHRPLSAAIGAAVDELGVARDEVEAFLTWANCPSLSALAAEFGKPVIHNELGALRGPFYQDTVYFDFRGVNGNTTPAREWTDRAALAAQLEGVPLLTDQALRQLLCAGPLPGAPARTLPRYALGVALQVEDDSNTLAYGRGVDAIRLLYLAQRNLASEQVLVRSHPAARLGYRGGLGERDTSASSLDFLQRIDHLITINSSVAAEAALWNVPFTVLGDTPFAVISLPREALPDAQPTLAPGAPPAPAQAPLPASEQSAPAATETVAAVAPAADAAAPVPAAPAQVEAAMPVPAVPEGSVNPALNALLLGYLVPSSLLFDPDYYRWRLAGATLGDCMARHLELFKRSATHVQSAVLPGLGASVAAAPGPAATGLPHRNAAFWTATRSLSRSAAALQERLDDLEAELATAVRERDKNWDERCWFQTNLERIEQELASLHGERDSLRLALAKQQAESDVLKHCLEANTARAEQARQAAVDALAKKTLEQQAVIDALASKTEQQQAMGDALRIRYGQMELVLAEMQQRFDTFSEELTHSHGRHATAQAQSTALLDELHRTQRERIDALAKGSANPSP